jgi:hypothetical protein
MPAVVQIGAVWMAVDDDMARGMADERLQRANAILDRIERSGVNVRDHSAADFLVREAEDILGQIGDLKADAEPRVEHPRPSSAPPPPRKGETSSLTEALRELAAPGKRSTGDRTVTVRRVAPGRFEVKGLGHSRAFETCQAAETAASLWHDVYGDDD